MSSGQRVIEAIAHLREVAFWMERSRQGRRRSEAHRRAADALEAIDPADVLLLHERGGVQQVPGVGPSTGAVVAAALEGLIPPALQTLRDQGAMPLASSSLFGRLRGDLHTHTTWSDGRAPLHEMVATAEWLGREYCAITDHSPRLRVANGLSRERLQQQWDEIDRVQRGVGVRVLKGIEVDILDDGTLDQDEDLLSRLDVVVASVHSKLGMDADSMTRRMVRAIANPHTTVLGHCTGRLVEGERGTRPPSQFDAEVVFQACVQFGVAVEINSRPERHDPPDELLALAHDMGCLFSIDTDAHAPGQLDFLALGAARAEAHGIEAERIITTWPVDEVVHFAQS